MDLRASKLIAEAGSTPAIGAEANRPCPVRWAAVAGTVVAISIVLGLLPGRTRIPPRVESDYCYLLTAADRLHDGAGLTTPQPFAPGQPWSWRSDWMFLTKWPIGYPMLIAVVRWGSGLSTIQATGWISVVACAMTLVGWFVWIRRCVPPGVTGILLSGVGAGCAVSTAALIDPSTDLLVVAALPFVLLCTLRAIELLQSDRSESGPGLATLWLACAGLIAGGLFWIRYASVFVPFAIGLYLVGQRFGPRKIAWSRIGVFAACAAAPIAALVFINRQFGTGGSLQEQLNLGSTARVQFSWDLLTAAWSNFTRLGFYDYAPSSRWVTALWPIVLLAAVMCSRATRRGLRAFVATPAIGLSCVTVASLLAMLVGVTAIFGDKYDYVGLDRYYSPIKPLYFALFAAPVLLVPWRTVRAVSCVVLVVAASWIVRQEWPRPYKRWLAAKREVTPYGQWANCFQPGATDLYGWLESRKDPSLIVVSNFHDHITLETKIPAVPIPPDAMALNDWIERISESRGVTEPRVLFVLDVNNQHRDYFFAKPTAIVETFDLRSRVDLRGAASAQVFEYSGHVNSSRVTAK